MAHIQPKNLQSVQKIRFRQKVLGLTGLIWWSRTLKVPAVNQSLACVASVSVEQRFRRFVRAKNGARAKTRRRGMEEGKETLVSSYFCSRPIFRSDKTPKTPFFALCSTEMLATQATIPTTSAIYDPKNIKFFHNLSYFYFGNKLFSSFVICSCFTCKVTEA